MNLEVLEQLCRSHEGDEQDWLAAWLEVGPKLVALAKAAREHLSYTEVYSACPSQIRAKWDLKRALCDIGMNT